MKKMIVSALMLAAFTATVHAKEVKTAAMTTVATADDDNKTKVEIAALPDAVKATLASDAYKGWTATTAWQVKADPVYYIIEMKQGDKATSVKIGQDGKVM